MPSSLMRWSGWAAMLGGLLLYLALTMIYFVFMHGSGESQPA